VDLSFEQRLLRFLDREESAEARQLHELRALPVDERVVEGECIAEAVCEQKLPDGWQFRVGENLSKFRSGDPVTVGDGHDFEAAMPLVYGAFDAGKQTLRLELDRFARGGLFRLEPGRSYCIDRRGLGLFGRLHDSVRAAFAEPRLCALLDGAAPRELDAGRHARAAAALAARGLNAAQIDAGARLIATQALQLVQGPPGTGKTRLLAEVLALLARAGARLVVSAFTNRAVDNVLLALRGLAPDVAAYKLGFHGDAADELLAAGVQIASPRRPNLPSRAVVVAGTCFQLIKLPASERFHLAVFDEAGQMPIPHAIAGMLLSPRLALLGDHLQLPPVITERHADLAVVRSIFEHLEEQYGSRMLDVTYRMNDQVCALVSNAFYGGRLHADASAARRRLPFQPGGKLDEVLDPERSVVWARVDHLQPGPRSLEEANLVADLVEDCVRRHRVPPAEIAVIAPFRAQVRAIRSALQKRDLDAEATIVDTVERIQGQEREVVLVSLAAGDPDALRHRAEFFFSRNRLNVALSRARVKAVLIASRHAFTALPADAECLRAAAVFRRVAASMPHVDLTAVYASTHAG
jgi:DNA replication ATP-dependent helicase Dna2